MSSYTDVVVERPATRGLRQGLLSLVLLCLLVLAGWAVMQIASAINAGHDWRAFTFGFATLLTIGAWLRIMSLYWHASARRSPRSVEAEDDNESAGLWGVGGPSGRDPGDTGQFQRPEFGRQYDPPED